MLLILHIIDYQNIIIKTLTNLAKFLQVAYDIEIKEGNDYYEKKKNFKKWIWSLYKLQYSLGYI